MAPLVAVKNLSCVWPEGDPIFVNVTFNVNPGDIIVLQARSGAGKTTLLKCLAHLNLYHGTVEFRGKTPKSHGVPKYRTYVQYIPQRPSLLPGTPRDLIETLSTFHSRLTPEHFAGDLHRAMKLAERWGIAMELWDRPWGLLSGGEAQRLSLAIPYGLNRAEVLLLDEPTSALDPTSSATIEKTLVEEVRAADSALKAIVWITHSEEQAARVGTRFLHLTPTGIQEEYTNEV
ncbi:P-loop containing nucleoside triphosphate hydrolase protein [Multifurca ochricompacta]|uniref:P-loop containing nucleoside triphosphate hydrolase protein n=1 Tax=Multifurca ochricompacta TaxID=376703 RepID=A0AAD4MAN1_9AGAM|nr:P-loop containing nucleoside triphosphate hydrolase protein [Multifurca ochricompacta]